MVLDFMKLPIIKTLSAGFSVVKKNPVLILPPLIGNLIFVLYRVFFEAYPSTVHSTLIAFLSSTVSVFTYAITIHAGYDAVRKRKISFGKSFDVVLGKLIPIALATLLMVAISLAGFILLIIPGIFLVVKLFFYEFAILLDNMGVKSSLKKSWHITKGNWWNIFAFLLLMCLAYIPLAIIDVVVLLLFPVVSLVLSPVLFSSITAWYTVSLVVAYMKLRRR
jgi:hypothetical protein